MFAAVLDTCVLWPSLQRDFILSMAIEGLYRPLWSDAILAELHRHEVLKLERRGADPDEAAERADHLINQMRRYFDDALVIGWDGLDGTYGLPDPDDEHVVAAAVVGGAGAIVTDNVKDFPAEVVPSHLQILSAQEFAANTADVDPSRAAQALQVLARRHQRPPRTAAELLDLLVRRYQMTEVGEILAPVIEP
ncbi:PIN domain-containing protein [Jiangella alkaliphila]|uniref:PIN domain-containing protein n=1 Tax=Jiangella alkaliphila TaxID=419479 RepID=A0A1H2LT49_9ACTN|nr:PIN domain-containing protein [Jiangella alkaliphila]SDU83486.1 PIN domain-containing protein [Jiangella alkaliphila]